MKLTLKNFIVAGTLLAMSAGIGCKKDSTTSPTNTNNNASGVTSLQAFYNACGTKMQNYTLNATTGGTITGIKGTSFTFWANSFLTPTNAVASGNINIEIKEIYSNADIILSNMPTVSNNQPLQSGGEYYIAASQGNQPLHLNTGYSYQVKMPMVDTLPLALFNGVVSAGKVNWIQSQDTMTVNTHDSAHINNVVYNSNPNYLIDCDSLGWENGDQFYPGPYYQDTAFTNCPTSSQTSLFIYVNGHHAVWSFLSTSYPNKFVTYSDVPSGVPLTLVGISVTKSGQFYSSFQPFTNPGSIQNLTVNFSLSDTTTFLNQLKALK